MHPKVILDPHFRTMEPLFPPETLSRMRGFAQIVWARDDPIPDEELVRHAPDAEAVIVGHWRYGDVRRFPRLRAILEVGGSFPRPLTRTDSGATAAGAESCGGGGALSARGSAPASELDYEHCFRSGIRVLSCAPGFAPAVAEMALGMAIAAGRGLVSGDAAFRRGEEVWGHRGRVQDFLLFDKPVGFIGFGSIARCLKGLLAPFRCRVFAYDPWLTDAWLRLQGVEPVPLERLVAESKITFVLAVPSAANRALLDRSLLERIPRGSVLVLISRSHLVDFDALTELVLAGRLQAAIDVFPEEPLPSDHPIRRAPGAILSAHRAGGGPETYQLIGRMVANDLEAVLTGRVPQEMQQAQPEYILARG